jgi:hypothetical protein
MISNETLFQFLYLLANDPRYAVIGAHSDRATVDSSFIQRIFVWKDLL